MSLPAPNLDDRRFQDLVDDAKRMVQQRCPEWTDHNVSDPGVTLLETFAFMVDTLLYRLNRVPDRLYLKFLDLIGIRLHPPTAARADITFWLASPADEPRTIPADTVVATPRTETDEAIAFTTLADLEVVPCSRSRVVIQRFEGELQDITATIDDQREVDGFSSPPLPGDTIHIGLSDAVPRAAVAVRLDCEIDGVGVDPVNPPLRWEAWAGDRWVRCELDRDETGGLNRAGDVVIHVPPSHRVSVIAKHRAGWIRCVVTEPEEDQPFYSAPPKIRQVQAFTIGGTTEAVNSERVVEEVLGVSDGVPAQSFDLVRRPVVASDEPVVVEVSVGDGWSEWTTVSSFADSGPADRHVVLDATLGQVSFGPATREPDGDLRFYGAVPAKGAVVRVRSYRTGGGQRGNLTRGALSVLKSSLPGVTRVENRHPAGGGVDGETIEAAKRRGPVALRTRNRAVTVEDYEHLARESAPEVARVRVVAATQDDPGAVRVLVVPAVGDDDDLGQLRFEQLVPDDETLATISSYLDARRCVGARVIVEPPVYQGITIVARVRPRPQVAAPRLQQACVAALNRYFHALTGGPDGDGWPFGRPILVGEVYSVLQGVRGTELVEDVRLFAADPLTGTRGEQVTRIDPGDHALVFSYQHQVQVQVQDGAAP